MLFPLPKKTTL